MRAKLQVVNVNRFATSEQLKMSAVCKTGGYTGKGEDEDNTYALYSPQAEFTITVNNSALFGKFNPGDKFYVDFTKAEA